MNKTRAACLECGDISSNRRVKGLCRKCYVKRWTKSNSGRSREIKDAWVYNNRAKRILSVLRWKSKKNNIPFSIVEEDLLPFPVVCPVLGIQLDYEAEKNAHNAPSVDRVIPSLGYIKGNVHIISMRANTLKRDGTSEELEKVLSYIRENTNAA